MGKVYVVHTESGAYSAWLYVVKGVFDSYDGAKEYIESQTVEVYRQKFVEHKGDWYRNVDRWTDDEDDPGNIVEKRVVFPTSTDGNMFRYKMPDGTNFQHAYECYFITEYELNVPVADE